MQKALLISFIREFLVGGLRMSIFDKLAYQEDDFESDDDSDDDDSDDGDSDSDESN